MTLFGKILAILNILAAAGFAYIAFLDHGKREQASAAAREHDLAPGGLPLQEQFNDPSQPRERFSIDQPDSPDSDLLKGRFQANGAPGQPVPVQTDEVKRVQRALLPTDDQLKQRAILLGKVKGEKRALLDKDQHPDLFIDKEEGGGLLSSIEKAAEKFVKDIIKKAKDKETALQEVLVPLAFTGAQLGTFRDRIVTAKKAKDKEMALAWLLLEAAKRKMFAQVLLPLEESRPRGRRDELAALLGDLTKPLNKWEDHLGSLSQLEKLVADHLDEVLRPVPLDTTPLAAKKDDKDKKAQPETAGLIFDLVTVKGSPFRIRYNRSPKDQAVTVALIDSAGKEVSGGDKVSIKLSNVEGQPHINLTASGAAYSGKDEAFAKDQVLAGEISLSVSGKEERCPFSEREPMDQRHGIASLLFTISQVNGPDGKTPLVDLPEKRVEVIVGRQRFNRAVEMQTLLFRQIAERRKPIIEADREAFIERYRVELNRRLPYLVAAIERHKAIVKYWEDQLELHETQRRERRKFRDQILAKVQEERKKATEALDELKKFQDAMFKAQEAGSGVAEENQRLEKLIRLLETGR